MAADTTTHTTDPEVLVCTGRELHRTTITLDPDGDPEAAVCECGGVWCELTDPPATEWFHTHQRPIPKRIIQARVVSR